MIYIDTSALVKLVRREPESDSLSDWLDSRTVTPWVSSALIEIELPRALRRSEPARLVDVASVLARVSRYDIDDVVRAAAASYPDPSLRSLDAIHLATAHAVFGSRLTAFVCYDERLRYAASTLGLNCQTPQ
jgi:predicted nucleic acid-binding protein